MRDVLDMRLALPREPTWQHCRWAVYKLTGVDLFTYPGRAYGYINMAADGVDIFAKPDRSREEIIKTLIYNPVLFVVDHSFNVSI